MRRTVAAEGGRDPEGGGERGRGKGGGEGGGERGREGEREYTNVHRHLLEVA